jgi:hypothetical protein
VIDWGAESGLHVFCAVLAWSRFRFVRFAADERAETTLGLLAECFQRGQRRESTGLLICLHATSAGVAQLGRKAVQDA